MCPKAPHLAALAAQRLGRRLRIVGPIHDEQYVRRHADILHADHVEWVGEVGGADKAAVLRAGETLVYTCSRAYVEAGAAVFGEALRAGTPVAALAWRPGTCAQAALCEQTGVVAAVNAEDDDETRPMPWRWPSRRPPTLILTPSRLSVSTRFIR